MLGIKKLFAAIGIFVMFGLVFAGVNSYRSVHEDYNECVTEYEEFTEELSAFKENRQYDVLLDSNPHLILQNGFEIKGEYSGVLADAVKELEGFQQLFNSGLTVEQSAVAVDLLKDVCKTNQAMIKKTEVAMNSYVSMSKVNYGIVSVAVGFLALLTVFYVVWAIFVFKEKKEEVLVILDEEPKE